MVLLDLVTSYSMNDLVDRLRKAAVSKSYMPRSVRNLLNDAADEIECHEVSWNADIDAIKSRARLTRWLMKRLKAT
jgi:RimJ/RimL family protein N-acetyltransferase